MTKLSDKEQMLEKKAVELSSVIKSISAGYACGADVSALQKKREELRTEIDVLRKEVGYRCRDDFER
jgi:hypothetical protein